MKEKIESLKSAYYPWMESFGVKETIDRLLLKQDEIVQRLNELENQP